MLTLLWQLPQLHIYTLKREMVGTNGGDEPNAKHSLRLNHGKGLFTGTNRYFAEC